MYCYDANVINPLTQSNNRCHFTKACIHTASRAIHASNPLLKMSMHLHKSRFTPTSLPSTSPSWINVVEQRTNSTNDECLLHHGNLGRASNDQDSMKPALHSCLELLDQLCDRLNSTYKETLEIRARITEILAVGNTGARDSDVNPILGDKPPTIAPVALDELDFIPFWSTPPNLALLSQPPVFQNSHGHPSNQGYEYLSQASVGAISTVPEDPNPAIHRLPQDPFLPGTSGSISYELDTQLFQKFSQDDEGQAISGPSGIHYQQLSLPVAQNGESKVECMWSGCTSVVKKDNYTRHVNEIHKRLFKAVCTSCGKVFLRPYMKKTHTCPDRHAKRGSS